MFYERRFSIEEATTKNAHARYSIADNNSCIAIQFGFEPISLYGFDGSKIVKRATLPYKHGYQSVGSNFVVSPDGQHVATYSSYPDHWDTIKLWDTHTEKLLHEYIAQAEFPINRSNPSIMNLSFRADGKQLVALTDLGEVAIWSTINGNLLRFVGSNSINTHAMALSHDGNWFVSLDDNVEGLPSYTNNTVYFVGRYRQRGRRLYGYKLNLRYFLERLFHSASPLETSQPLPNYLPPDTIRVGEVEAVVFKIWDAYSGAPIRDLALPKSDNEIASRTYSSWIRSFLLSHDDLLLAGVADETIYIWNTITGDISQTIILDTKFHLLDFSQDDYYLICYGASGIQLWDVEQQAWTVNYTIEGQLQSVAMSDTNRISATVWNGKHWEIAVIDLYL